MNAICYIIGPYASYMDQDADTHSERQNVARAVALGSLALTRGLIPIIPHITIGCSSLLLGEYGHPDADGLARKASYGDGDGGLAGELARAWNARLGDPVHKAELWVVVREDGLLSTGTKAERDVVLRHAGHVVETAWTWTLWRDAFAEAGLENLWRDAGSRSGARFPRWPGDHP